MRLIRTLFVAALAMGASLAHADDSAAVQRLTGLLNKAQTLTARFSQLTLDGSGTRLQETAGQLSLKRPGLFRWHTDAPNEQLLISNGEKVWLYDPDLEQVTIQKLDQRLTQTPALLLSGDISKISESFAITYKEGGNVVDFVLAEDQGHPLRHIAPVVPQRQGERHADDRWRRPAHQHPVLRRR